MLVNPSLTIAAGTDLTGGGAVALGASTMLNLDITKVPQLGTANTFAATQTISSGNLALSSGNLALPDTNGSGTAGVLTFNGQPFLQECCSGSSSANVFLGEGAGSFTTTGSNNTALGAGAGAFGATGSNNTFVGANAWGTLTGLTNATAIGAGAKVGESNALVLGAVGPNAVNVGIGTAVPQFTLDVQGTGNFTGLVTFASGQTFPGAGTVTSVGTPAAGGLTGGPITTSGALSIATAGVTNAMLQNPALTINTGTGLSGGGTEVLGGSFTLTNTGVLAVGTTSGSGILVGGTSANPSLSADTTVLATNSSVTSTVTSAVSSGVTTAENFATSAVNTASTAITGSALTLNTSSPITGGR